MGIAEIQINSSRRLLPRTDQGKTYLLTKVKFYRLQRSGYTLIVRVHQQEQLGCIPLDVMRGPKSMIFF